MFHRLEHVFEAKQASEKADVAAKRLQAAVCVRWLCPPSYSLMPLAPQVTARLQQLQLAGSSEDSGGSLLFHFRVFLPVLSHPPADFASPLVYTPFEWDEATENGLFDTIQALHAAIPLEIRKLCVHQCLVCPVYDS